MKKFLSKPKIIIPVFAIIVLVLTIKLYRNIGNPPVVSINQGAPLSLQATSATNISLSFAKSGRIESVMVKEGEKVTQGEVLAKLSAPDAEGAVSQAKGALDLAEAQYASLNVEYSTTKKQQDLLVENAYKTLLSGGLEATPDKQDQNVPIISGTYTCGKEGSYVIDPYPSGDSSSGYSANFTGLESGTIAVKYDNPVPLGNCGLQVKFSHVANFNPETTWTIAIPNVKGSVYLDNKNAYDLAVNTRDKTLAGLVSQIGENSNDPSVAKAQISAAEGAYQAAVGAYQNNLIVSPVDGVVSFLDPDLKVGQSVVSGKAVISINQ